MIKREAPISWRPSKEASLALAKLMEWNPKGRRNEVLNGAVIRAAELGLDLSVADREANRGAGGSPALDTGHDAGDPVDRFLAPRTRPTLPPDAPKLDRLLSPPPKAVVVKPRGDAPTKPAVAYGIGADFVGEQYREVLEEKMREGVAKFPGRKK